MLKTWAAGEAPLLACEAGSALGLLAVFAHPDDESFRCGGTLSLLSQRGMRVQVLTATRGEAGSCGDPPLCHPEELAAVREGELRCACAALGIQPPLLLGYRDGELVNVAEEEAVARVLEAIQAWQPQFVLTWPPDGLSGHPDHVAVSRWTTLAFEQAGTLGLAAPAALFHLAVPRSVAEILGLGHLHAVPDEAVTLMVDVTPVWEEKLAAINCHRTQAGGLSLLSVTEERQRLFLGKEHFCRVRGREQRDLAHLEDDPKARH